VETLSFSTPARTRAEQPVEVDLCGETITVRRPKQAVLYFAQAIIGDTVSDADRAMSLLQFLDAGLSPLDRKRFFDRCLDREDPLNLQAALDMLNGLIDRWNNWPAKCKPARVVVTPNGGAVVGEDIELVHEDLGIRFTAHPVKDIVMMIVQASMAAGANSGQQAWAVAIFLDAALEPGDAFVVARRMRNPDDDLDLEHIAEMVESLLKRWGSGGNRAERRAARTNLKAVDGGAKPKPAAKRTTKSRRTIQRA
jgi:hypothetical protein